MSQSSKRRWLPRFSLKMFLLFNLLGGGGVAWVSHSYGEYLAEQRLIEDLTKRVRPQSSMTVATNGETTRRVGFSYN